MSFDYGKFKGTNAPFYAFDDIGQTLTGTVVGVREHTWDEKKGPKLILDVQKRATDEIVSVSCPFDLQRQVAEIEVQVGDEIRFKFSGTQKLQGQVQPMKLFEVTHRVAEEPPVVENGPDIADYSEEPF